jgi:hypothetical protein
MRLTMREIEYKVNAKTLDLYAGARLVATAFGGGKPSDIVELWVDEIADESRRELVAELKEQDWVKNILNGTRKQV